MVDELYHYGTPRHSGRYPWGSGEDPYQHETYFLNQVKTMQKQGMSEKDIAKGLGMTTTELRAKKSIEKDRVRQANVATAIRLKDSGMSANAAAKQMGIAESSYRSLLNNSINERSKITNSVADVLKKRVSESKYIDIGTGSEQFLGVSESKMRTAIQKLKNEEGYTIHYIQVNQLGTANGNKTTVKVLAAPGTTYSEVYKNRDNIELPIHYFTEDGGRSYLGVQKPKSLDSNRVMVRYAEEGGINKDGVIELRRGVDDISLGNARYAQVRIAVDDTHYLKGMAVYSDDMPDGVDVIFNTNKHVGTPKEKVFKELKKVKDPETGEDTKNIDWDNPFGATIKREEDLIRAQRYYTDKDGKKQLSCVNIVNEEGDWDKWSKTLSSQMLSKQRPEVAKRQLDLAYSEKKEEFNEIVSLTNPAVKKRLLESFADDCDSSSVHLKAAAMPRQRSQVILPLTSIKDNEIYAPNFNNGENVVLVRYPHGGTFEIPQLKVNNNNKEAKNVIGNGIDAVGISSSVAARLSGADFDGDTVLVIPNRTGAIKTSSPLKGLKNFDPSEAYPAYEGMEKIKSRTKQQEMGNVSNLITDMTIKGANEDEICRAVKHSMVVIDAEKHNLNWKQSYIDNGIAELKAKYQGGENRGASTLISRASSEIRVPTRSEGIKDPKTGKKIYIDPKTGKKLYSDMPDDVYINDKGQEVRRTTMSTKMAETDDAYSLSSGTRMENIYASYANRLKALANEARKEQIATKTIPYSPSAKKTYFKEVESLKSKLNLAIKDRPLERQAQILANHIYRTKKEANPFMDKDEAKKIKTQALSEARARFVGPEGRHKVTITDREWDAIQAGAVSNNTLTQILKVADLDEVKKLATPKNKPTLSNAKVSRVKAMANAGYTQAEIAESLGLSISTVNKAING